MEYMMNVCVENGPIAVFDTADEAVSFAKSHVYLSPYQHKIAVDTLNQGQMYSFSYGFSAVHITPVAKRKTQN